MRGPSRVSSDTDVPSAAAVIGTVDGAVQVVALPPEQRVRPLDDLDEQVAGRAAAGAGLALAGELDPGAGVDAGRDLDGERPAGAHPAVAAALVARVRDHACRSPGRPRTAGRSSPGRGSCG